MQLSDTVRIAEHQDGAVLLDLGRGKFFSVDPVGMLIVSWLKEPIEMGTVIERLVNHFPDIPEGVLQRDLGSFLEELARLNVVVVAPTQGERPN